MTDATLPEPTAAALRSYIEERLGREVRLDPAPRRIAGGMRTDVYAFGVATGLSAGLSAWSKPLVLRLISNDQPASAVEHEHSYSRTKTLLSMQNQLTTPLWPDAGEVSVGNGSTFAFVSGLAGRSIRNQDRCLPITPPYGCNGEWASIYTSNQGANYGAMFIEFHVDGDPRKANGYFKDIDLNVIDTFTISAAPPKLAIGDTDGDGCTDQQENGLDEELGGRRDYLNPWDFYDVVGPAGGPPDGVIDLPNDILGVIQHFSPHGAAPYDVQYDRGPAFGGDAWDMGPPDGVIDLPNDLLGVILQFNHKCL